MYLYSAANISISNYLPKKLPTNFTNRTPTCLIKQQERQKTILTAFHCGISPWPFKTTGQSEYFYGFASAIRKLRLISCSSCPLLYVRAQEKLKMRVCEKNVRNKERTIQLSVLSVFSSACVFFPGITMN